ncbi:hypothetical protein TUMEXPCC7403_06185 [Tumidithrix helvetica PCC 7403]|uniref:hypothetical protein n=1 Tax=Tumidithrix helvetica TaxID=3457545 RepID=UPI003C9EF3EA
MINSLDILAIAIFSITMLALLGPVVGISPFVPAGIAVLLLGLYAIDRALWQGKGGDFLMSWLRQRSPQYSQQVLYHETGHFLAAHLLGMKILGYRLRCSGDYKFGQQTVGEMPVGIERGVAVEGILEPKTAKDAKSEPQVNGKITPNYLDRCCTVWMAGIAAEQLFCKGTEDYGGAEDIRQLRAAIATFKPAFQQDVELEQRWALLRAKVLLRDRKDAFEALAALMDRGASIEECCEAIDLNIEKSIEKNLFITAE